MSYPLESHPYLRRFLKLLGLVRPVRIGYIYGRKLWYAPGGVARWCDTGAPLNPEEPVTWPCPKCGLLRAQDGHDPCISYLPGVLFACCGHGVEDGYIYFADGRTIRGQFAISEYRHVNDQMDDMLKLGETHLPHYEHIQKTAMALAAWEQEIWR